MNAALEHHARGMSASSEARQRMADWLRTTKNPKVLRIDLRKMLIQRYPAGLLEEAELEALICVHRDAKTSF
jgi:polynucleotide 5'-kinase involved in rRNA processing